MNTFKRKALSCAILGGLGAAAGSAHAVYQDPTGIGQVLLYPYYTVQQSGSNSYNTYISVVNTTTRGKAVKVRFREGKNSREVLDFNLFLSPNDVWTGAVVPADSTTTSAARLITSDTSCTNPAIPSAGIDFRNFAYVGANADNAGAGVDRTREGYLEILEMANVNNVAPLNALTAITHVQPANTSDDSARPANCAVVQTSNLATTAPAGTFTSASGGLAGTFTLINVNNGADMGGNAVALSNFLLPANNLLGNYTDVGDENFGLNSGDPVSVVVNTSTTGTTAYLSNFGGLATGRVDAVSSTMMHNSVINEFAIDAATLSQTDWVLTFPTKRFYVSTTAATTPFTNKFTAQGACELINFTYFNREERVGIGQPGDFSPSQGTTPDSLCWESTVFSIRSSRSTLTHTATLPANASGVLASQNLTVFNPTSNQVPVPQNGWAQLSFQGANALNVGITTAATGNTATNVNTGAVLNTVQNYRGLPVIGFMARTLTNNAVSCRNAAGATATCLSNYGSLFDHKFTQVITPNP